MLLTSCFATNVHSQSLNDHLILANIDGLDAANVTLQDNQGYIWFGDHRGLHRYNGYEIKSFSYDKSNPLSLSNNNVTSLYIDLKGTLWVGTNQGLNQYNALTESFTRIKTTDTDNWNNLAINSILIDKQGIVWLATLHSGVVRYNPEQNQFHALALTSPTPASNLNNTSNSFWDIKQQTDGTIWIASTLGLYKLDFDYGQNTITSSHIYTPKNSNLTHSDILSLAIDKQQNLWIGTQSGLNFYHQQHKTFSQPANTPLKSAKISNLTFDKQNNLWLATWGAGIYQIDETNVKHIQKNGHFEQINLNEIKQLSGENATKVADISNHIYTLYSDHNGILWILTANGIHKLPIHSLNIEYVKHNHQITANAIHQIGQSFNLSGEFVTNILADQQGYLWFATNNALTRYHVDSKTTDYYTHQPTKTNSLPSNNIAAVYQDNSQQIWVATDKGLAQFNPQSNDFTSIAVNLTPEQDSHQQNAISAISEDNQGNLWLASKTGLLKYSRTSKRFTLIKDKQLPSIINSLMYDGLDTIWIGSHLKNLTAYSLSTGTFNTIQDSQGSPIYEIYDLKLVTDGAIWIASSQGLALIDKHQNVTHYKDQSHSDNDIRSIEIDRSGTLWLGTAIGIKSFDPQKKQFTLFNQAHGLLNNSYRGTSSAIDKNGRLYFAGNIGLEHFMPQKLKRHTLPPQLVLSELLIDNRPTPIKPNQTGQNPNIFSLPRAINYLNTITLSHQHNIFSFNFAALNFITERQNQYAYRLTGFNDYWIYTNSKNRHATFSNIPPGEYQFELKAANHDNIWSPIKTIQITILPPWWRSTLAYTFYAILLICTFTITYRWRTGTLIATNKQLTQQLQQRNKTIGELISQKENMFATIYHEHRTPLTLIQNPAERLNNEQHQPSSSTNANLAPNNKNDKRHAPRLIRMVEQLVKTNKGSTGDERHHYRLKNTLDYLMTSFEQVFAKAQLTVSVSRYNDVTLSLKPDTLEIILTNLISNAVKYTPHGGSININIETHKNHVAITISDNGIGIAAKDQVQIFDHSTAKPPKHHNAQKKIGLAFIKDLVQSNQGKIELTSALNQGSSFTVTLPISKNKHNDPQPSATSKQYIAVEVSNLSNKQQLEQLSNHNDSQSVEHKPLVLIIDDNQDLLHLIEEILSPHFDCQLASNGEQGLQMAQEYLPDLVLSDIMMPGISGLEVLSELKSSSLTAHIPVVLLTAKGDAETRIEGWKNRADEYISKPFHNQELVARINNILAIRKMSSSRYQQQFAHLTSQTNHEIDSEQNNQQQSDERDIDQLDIVSQHFSEQLEQVLAHHYHDEHLTVATIAQELALSQRQLIRKTKSLLGMTPNESLRAFRLKQAAKFLRQGQTPSTITFNVGFSSHSYFGLCFKAQFGCTPTEYRKQHLNKSSKGTEQ